MLRVFPKDLSKSVFYGDVPQAAWPFLSAYLAEAGNRRLTVVSAESFSDCEYFYAQLKYFIDLVKFDADVRLLPPLLPTGDSKYFDAACERVGVVNELSELAKNFSSKKIVLLSTPASLADSMRGEQVFEGVGISRGQHTELSLLKQKLADFGYYNEALCEAPGQFSVRGGVLDVYPAAASCPVRLDFFGDEIESIRTFNPDTQLSDGKIEKIRIDPVPERLQSEGGEGSFCAFDLISDIPSNWIFLEPRQLELKYSEEFSTDENIVSKKSYARAFGHSESFFAGISVTGAAGEIFENAANGVFEAEDFSLCSEDFFDSQIGVERFDSERAGRLDFARSLSRIAKGGAGVFISSENDADRDVVRELFKDADADFAGCSFLRGRLASGFFVKNFGATGVVSAFGKFAGGAAFVPAARILGRRVKPELQPRRKLLSRRAQVDQLLDFSELGEGDYVVHYGHGVCRYHGVVKLDTNGVPQEFLKLEFEDEAYLYLPLHESHLLGRYIGLDKKCPKLAKLDSKSWTKIRAAAEHAALDYAAELLQTQSKRETAEGFAFPEDYRWQQSFDDSFAYAETPDQLRAIAEVKADMVSGLPMERLLCADVGFGKTEVAMRAAFKAAMAGKQIAILCPTTILCQQHFRNFRERFAGYPVVVEMLSRFRTRIEAQSIKAQLAAGKIDIIIGTHALLSADVCFKDLGLLVIDEEHRFGVRHKERIKKLRAGIDVLSMSATPIPRTLYFAMMGARKISLMETPPKDRFPVETMVREYSEDVVKAAIETEVSRGGQVFYLHNRVDSIAATADKIREMFPNLRVAVGHGQMGETRLERLMSDFVDGKYDVLVCTTIIESGLDIPNCNTIIIEGADKFGLAQLYQLRGRVGRFTRRAYAWLLLHRHAVLVENARKRLGAIRQYNKPGAGFRIATRDLQLRGCGNLLGAKQSGHIAGVGFDLYCSLLKRSIALLKGERKAYWVRAKVALDFVVLGEGGKSKNTLSNADTLYQEIKMKETFAGAVKTVNAYVPADYVPQTQLRVDLYRSLSRAESIKELAEIAVATEDRFGEIPQPLAILFFLARIRVLAESNSLIAVETEGASLKLRLNSESKIEHFRINGRFPRLSASKPAERLAEIEKFLKYTYPSLKKI